MLGLPLYDFVTIHHRAVFRKGGTSTRLVVDTSSKRVKEMQEICERGARELSVAIHVVALDVVGLKVQTRD
jgi:hypothetical protein